MSEGNATIHQLGCGKVSTECTCLYFRKKPIVVTAYKVREPTQVVTREGLLLAQAGDWIVCGIDGEQWPVANALMNEYYEPYIPEVAASAGVGAET